ncbi:ester cyclase [Ramlibacter sp. PS4R-6]|uniref:ester cyclase n=1 Tax=Ramlibacter sp. PS4R-6 TaxID=3133438 RepID=UPI0030B42E98
MTDLSAEAIVRSYYDALNARDYARAAGPIAENCEWLNMASGNVFHGPAAIVAGLREFTTSFPDWHVAVERVIGEGRYVVVEWHTTGTFRNDFRGHAPNGKRFSRRGCAVAEVESGCIVRYRDYYDRASLFAQLDLMELFKP